MKAITLLLPFLLILQVHAEITAVRDGEKLRIEIDGKLFTEYRSDKWIPYLYPLLNSEGVHHTRQYPFTEGVLGEQSDHPHHIGFWFTHGDVNGNDFWIGKDGCKIITKTMDDPVFQQKDGKNIGVSFTVNLEWIGRDEKRVLAETRTYQISYGENFRAIDVISKLDAIDGDVVFGDTKEGSFAIRVAPTLRLKGPVARGKITNSEGLEGDQAWGKRARWVAYHGPNWNERQTVIAIMDHPSNINYPTRWHARDYGLLAANPFGAKSFGDKVQAGGFTLKNGESQTQRYRLLLHEGDLQAANLEKTWEAFSKSE